MAAVDGSGSESIPPNYTQTELDAVIKIGEALETLDEDARKRILRWAAHGTSWLPPSGQEGRSDG